MDLCLRSVTFACVSVLLQGIEIFFLLPSISSLTAGDVLQSSQFVFKGFSHVVCILIFLGELEWNRIPQLQLEWDFTAACGNVLPGD